MDTLLQKVRERMGQIRTPSSSSLVYKDECTFSFDTPFSTGGVAVNLQTWQGFGEQFLKQDHGKNGTGLYLLQKWKTIPKTEEELAAAKTKANDDKLVIGASDVKIDKTHSLLLMPEMEEIPLPNDDIPMIVSQACDAVIKHDGVNFQESTAAFVDDFQAKESKYAKTLEQLPTGGKTIPSDPSLWKCDETGVTENLWLNLSTGFIGSGRKNWDGTGGNGAAERHFEATGSKYPLSVKLGTITPSGADVFSYAPDEMDMVLDPLLADHLAHWGIDTMKMQKTEKTMAELQVTLNMEYDWSKILEGDGSELKTLSGAGFVGIANLGNSCYLNSVMQCLFATDAINDKYCGDAAAKIFNTAPENPANDLSTQMAKFGQGLNSDRYSSIPEDKGNGEAEVNEICVRPNTFKSLVGRDHYEFSSSRQQDAAEYLSHMLEQLTKSERNAKERLGGNGEMTKHHFTLATEARMECVESKQVKYKLDETDILRLTVPIEAAENSQQYKEYQDSKRAKISSEDDKDAKEATVVPRVSFENCLNQYMADEMIDDWYSSALKKNSMGKRSQRFTNFPKYLTMQVSRYSIEQTKLDIEVPMPEFLDLERFRATGLQEGEVELSDEEPPAPKDEIDMGMVVQLQSMGFSENGCKRAVKACGQSGIEAASNWIFAHMEDTDFNSPIEAASNASSSSSGKPKPTADQIMMITALGCSNEQAEAALIATDCNPERAAEWFFSRMADFDAMNAEVARILNSSKDEANVDASTDSAASKEPKYSDGVGKYQMFAIISHLGKNLHSGHYVCHVKKDGKWAIFNDRKVGESKSPPFDVGYLYMYQRVE